MSTKPSPFFTFFNFSSDGYNKFHIGLSLQYYPEDITHDDDQLSTNPIRRKRLKIMKMMVSEDITHDDDQLSTKKIQDHEDDGIMETEEDCEEKEFIRRHRVLYFIFNRWCVIIYVSFRVQSWGIMFFGGF